MAHGEEVCAILRRVPLLIDFTSQKNLVISLL